MKLTPISHTHIDALQALAIRTYTAAFAHKNKPGVLERYCEAAFSKSVLLEQLSEPESYWYFAKEKEQIIGYLKLNTGNAQTEFQDQNGLEIERIYIDLPFIGKGIGGQLIDFSISEAYKLEKNYIWLGVWEENPDAIRFYKKYGFEITGTHQYDMIAEIQTDYVMRLKLL